MKSCESVSSQVRDRKRRSSDAGGPERTCLGCGRKAPKDRLLRFVVGENGTLELDFDQIRPGRGGYLCPEQGCFFLAARKKRLSARFRREVQIDPAGWLEQVRLRGLNVETTVPGNEQGESREGGEASFCSNQRRTIVRRDLLAVMLRSLDGGGGSEWPR